MPDVQFTGYGDGAQEFQAPNFKHYGNMDLNAYKEYVYENSCLLRLVRHDTLPMAACDFMLAGRDVVSNIPLKYASLIDTQGNSLLDRWDIYSPGFSSLRWPDTKKKIVQAIRNVRNKDCAHKRIDAHNYYADLLNREKYIKTIYGLAGVERA